MSRWMRTAVLDGVPPRGSDQTWTCLPGSGGAPREFPVVADTVKHFDVLGIEGTDLAEMRGCAQAPAGIAAARRT